MKPIYIPATGETCYSYEEYINSDYWVSFRERWHKRHPNAVCSNCGKRKKFNHLHHITYRNLGVETDDDVELRCAWCHSITHDKNFAVKRNRKHPILSDKRYIFNINRFVRLRGKQDIDWNFERDMVVDEVSKRINRIRMEYGLGWIPQEQILQNSEEKPS